VLDLEVNEDYIGFLLSLGMLVSNLPDRARNNRPNGEESHRQAQEDSTTSIQVLEMLNF
jgi:hypothetical protein